MTEPTRPVPVPAPPRAEDGTTSESTMPQTAESDTTVSGAAESGEPFSGLGQRPVAEHVAVFEAEHARLQRELGTIDQL